MFNLKFNQVFVGLLVLSFTSSFLLPPDIARSLRGVARLFTPVAWPARRIGSAMRERLAPEQTNDQRQTEDVKLENAELKVLAHNLAGQLDEMRRINGELEAVGEMRVMCTRFRVLGNDPSPARESLTIPATTADNVAVHTPVLYSVGVVGWIDRVNALGAQVQLITDPNFRAAARFARFVDGKPVILKTTQPLLVGAGRGGMEITNIPLRETKGNGAPDADAIAPGIWVVLDDENWPLGLKHRLLGEVEEVDQHDKAATFAHIRVRPLRNLETLDNVMVMNRTAPDPAMKSANLNP
jgi:cell shape-determining protein MreC